MSECKYCKNELEPIEEEELRYELKEFNILEIQGDKEKFRTTDKQFRQLWERNNMSEADKLFEELGYEKEYVQDKNMHRDEYIKYSNNELVSILFDIFRKKIAISDTSSWEFEARYVGMQELKAINMKVKQLGWSDE